MPAGNEETVIGGCLEEIRHILPAWDVVVVSDGSTDGTSTMVRTMGIPVIDLPLNLGVDGARRRGFSYGVRQGYDLVLQIDGDGQHDPAEVSHLTGALDSTGADIIIGARFAGRGDYAVRGPRKWAMMMLSRVLSRVCGTALTDVSSGLQLCGPRAIALYSQQSPAEYLGDTVEAIILAARSGLVVRQAGVSMRERAGGTPSHSPVKAAVFLVRAMVGIGDRAHTPAQNSRGGVMDYLLPLVFVLETILIMVVLIRRRVLKERFTVWWALLSLGLVVFAVFPPLLPFVATQLGFRTPSNFVFFAASLMVLLMSVQFSVEISQLDEKTRTLAEQLGILRTELEQHISATDAYGEIAADGTNPEDADA